MLEEFLKKYSYFLPERLIRKTPLEVRHDSKLLIYDTKEEKIYHDTFLNLEKYLPEGSRLILNQTKVVPARLNCVGRRGGKFPIFLVLNEWSGEGDISCFTDRKISKVNSRKIYPIKNKNIELEIFKKDDGISYLKNNFTTKEEFYNFLDKYGETPIPKYLESKDGVKGETLEEKYLRERYQTIFAKKGSSVAAPTASLHFTKEVFEKLKSKNILASFVSLEIGRGTFSTVKESNLIEGKLHKEKYFISENTRKTLENNNIHKVVVGTTSCRTIETYGVTGKSLGESDIFIKDDFNFKFTNSLITNFHLPESSLMAMIDSFLKFKNARLSIVELYKIAIENNYHFYSFGDSMLIV